MAWTFSGVFGVAEAPDPGEDLPWDEVPDRSTVPYGHLKKWFSAAFRVWTKSNW
ncbi:MAG: hypothetical protein PUC15_03300 [Lentisphaeria bacterium]|nr:hypothetical protein [Lentisphaeria bacterium]